MIRVVTKKFFKLVRINDTGDLEEVGACRESFVSGNILEFRLWRTR